MRTIFPCARPTYEIVLAFRTKEEYERFIEEMESEDGTVLRGQKEEA